MVALAMGLAASTGGNRRALLWNLPAVVFQLLAALRRNWPFALRAWALIAPLVLAAAVAYVRLGFKSNAGLIAAGAVVLTGLLFDRRTMALVLGALSIVPVGVGIAMVSGRLVADDLVDTSSYRALPWVRTTFVAVMTWIVLGLVITFVVQRIEGELSRTKRALAELQAEAARRMRAEAEQRAAEEAALQAQKIELVGRLAAGVAHDFNNLLGVVAGWTELGLGATSSDDDRQQARGALESTVQQGRALTRQLLALSRRDARSLSRLALERTVGQGVQTLSRIMPAGVKLTFEQGTPADVEADETELQQVLFNLVLNARDALPDRGGKIQVKTSLTSLNAVLDTATSELSPGRYATLSVSDNGCGIAPAVRERIFELFFTTKPLGCGTGLGLATVLRIAKESGGAIAVESRVGEDAGSTFTLYLPLASAAARARVSANA
jgi:signal transduction histidine kinase